MQLTFSHKLVVYLLNNSLNSNVQLFYSLVFNNVFFKTKTKKTVRQCWCDYGNELLRAKKKKRKTTLHFGCCKTYSKPVVAIPVNSSYYITEKLFFVWRLKAEIKKYGSRLKTFRYLIRSYYCSETAESKKVQQGPYLKVWWVVWWSELDDYIAPKAMKYEPGDFRFIAPHRLHHGHDSRPLLIIRFRVWKMINFLSCYTLVLRSIKT